MKKSSQVPATLIVAIAAGMSMAGCSDESPTYGCYDSMGRPIPDAGCRSGGVVGAHWVQTGGFGGGYGGGGGGGFGG